MENTYEGIETRKHTRRTYPAATRPVFRTRGQNFEVKDVSRGGLKFCHRDKININGWVKGTMNLTDGTLIKMEGIVVRVENEDMGLSFIAELEDDVYRLITAKRNSGN